jgi:cytochrome c-type biogenesis protein CcmF
VAEVFTGVRVAVGPPFFNSVFVPIGLALLALTGIGPLISWRRMSKGSFGRIVRIPLAVGAASALILGALGVTSVGALLAFALCAFTTTAIASEFARGSRLHRRRDGLAWPGALVRTVVRNRRRYGGYIVHLGVVLIVIGLAGASFRTERQAVLSPGERMDIGDYTLVYASLDEAETSEKRIFAANIEVLRDGDELTRLRPQRNFHVAQQQWQSEVAIRTDPIEDLYGVVTSVDPDGAIGLRAFVNPLTWWIWAGAGVMLGGMFVLLSGNRLVDEAVPSGARRAAPRWAT